MAQTLLIRGGDGTRGGYGTAGDVLVNKTADGVGLDEIWTEVRAATDAYNEQSSAIVSLLSYQTTRAGDAVAQDVLAERFEHATEFGVPTGISEPSYLKIGYSLRDYDKALRATWKYLRDASAEQVRDRVSRIYDADFRLVSGLVLQRLFTPATETNAEMLTVYGLWNGDGMVPPAHMGKTFDGSHTHYLTTNGTSLTATHVEGLAGHLKHHGFGSAKRAQLILLLHPDDLETSGMTAWRAGVAVGGVTPKYDFIVSSSAPAFLTAEHIEGTKPPAEYAGLPVVGSYGGVFVVESHFIPKGYIAAVASSGSNDSDNPIAIREHESADYRGLRLISGGRGQYPLIDAFFARTIGVGVRHRGAAVVCQIVAGTTYTAPTFDFVR